MRRLAHLALALGGLALIAFGLDAIGNPVAPGIVALPIGIAVLVVHIRHLTTR